MEDSEPADARSRKKTEETKVKFVPGQRQRFLHSEIMVLIIGRMGPTRNYWDPFFDFQIDSLEAIPDEKDCFCLTIHRAVG
jgi:hypothetical protein